MKSTKIFNTFIALALASVVSAQNKCSSKITNKGYKCCSDNCVPTFTDDDGSWAIENNEWCGCTPKTKTLSKCSKKITLKGYSCCPDDCKVVYTDDDGTWGYDNNEWCGCSPKTLSSKEQYYQRLDDIFADEKEIERKWLIDPEKVSPYQLRGEFLLMQKIRQSYICFDPEIRVREYSGNHKTYEMTIKNNLTFDGVVRDEVNIDIDDDQYDNLLAKKEGNTIVKTRYQFYKDGEVMALDFFEGDLKGLAYLEIEFPSLDDSDNYVAPDWVIKEVTGDIRYKNGYLARYGIPDPQ